MNNENKKATDILFVTNLCYLIPSILVRRIDNYVFRFDEKYLKGQDISYQHIYDSNYELFYKLFGKKDVPSIEFAKHINVVGSNDFVTYVDFYDNNGFIVFKELENVIYQFQSDGDLIELRHSSNYFYSLTDSFVVFNSEYNLFESIYSEDFKDVVCADEEILNFPSKHDGQIKEGDGQIYNLSEYVADRYPNYEFIESKYIRNYYWSYQTDNSVFAQNNYRSNGVATGGYGSEGNCVINATFSMLANLPTLKNQSGFCWRYNENYLTAYNPINYSTAVYADTFYPNYGTHKYIKTWYDEDYNDNLSSYWDINTHNNSRLNNAIEDLPTLYMRLRNVAISNGYKPNNGMLFSKTKKMVEETDSLYSYELQLNLSASKDSVISNINYNIPSLISTAGSETFGDHAMAVYGYAKYSYKKHILWWTETHYAYFWMVDSGWGPESDNRFFDTNGNRINWFDPNQSNISFAVLNRNKLSWPTC